MMETFLILLVMIVLLLLEGFSLVLKLP